MLDIRCELFGFTKKRKIYDKSRKKSLVNNPTGNLKKSLSRGE